MKMNKKGFTLIEMLVVIAIIAVLVSIIIPTVTSATDKAAAATNAANLRSYKATLTTEMLAGEGVTITTTGTGTSATHTVTVSADISANAPTAKECGAVVEGTPVTVTCTDGENLIVAFGTNKIDAFAKVAEGTAKAETLAATTVGE